MADNSFSKTDRLLSAEDFSYLRFKSKSLSNKFLKFYFKRSRLENSNTRIGIAASKKVGKANVRNTCKRQVREYFRNSEYRELGMDVLVTVSPFLFKKRTKKEAIVLLNSCLEDGFKRLKL